MIIFPIIFSSIPRNNLEHFPKTFRIFLRIFWDIYRNILFIAFRQNVSHFDRMCVCVCVCDKIFHVFANSIFLKNNSGHWRHWRLRSWHWRRLVSLVLTLNRFHTLFWSFHCSFWTSKCRLGCSYYSRFSKAISFTIFVNDQRRCYLFLY